VAAVVVPVLQLASRMAAKKTAARRIAREYWREVAQAKWFDNPIPVGTVGNGCAKPGHFAYAHKWLKKDQRSLVHVLR